MRLRPTHSATIAANTATAPSTTHCHPAGTKLIRLPVFDPRNPRSDGRIASYRMPILKCSMTAMTIATASSTGVAIQKRLISISNTM